MGQHAFIDEPEHCHVYRLMRTPPLPKLFGIESGWDMPIVRHRTALNGDVEFAGVPHYVLTYHIAGAAVRRMDRPDLDVVARTGAVSLQLPGSGGRYQSEDDRPVEYAHLYFRQSLLDTVLADLNDSGLRRPTDDFFGWVDLNWQRDIVSYLDRARDQRCPPATAEMDARARLVIYGLLRVAGQDAHGEDRSTTASLTGRQIRKVEEFVQSRLNDRIRLVEMASVIGLSPYHFSRLFKATTGETPKAFVMRLRTERAAKMLRETNSSISEIAFQCGFSSQSHLSRRVRQMFGVTPAQLRAADPAHDGQI